MPRKNNGPSQSSAFGHRHSAELELVIAKLRDSFRCGFPTRTEVAHGAKPASVDGVVGTVSRQQMLDADLRNHVVAVVGLGAEGDAGNPAD